ISPAGGDLSKANVADMAINITWGPATKITGITGSALGGAVNITLNDGKEYTVAGDVLTLNANAVAALLPVPISMVPDGTVMTLTIKFDQGEKTFDIKVVS
ncbi:MAG: X2-like carbohydrate binding domain-containing protein, partial [Syntrophomonadaceae bacterium]|nr:X2-like carbohydrate binding domain-containing protein [Syntrophomonadaceae bacterium]